MATNWQPTGNQTATQDSIGKDSIGKDNSIGAKRSRFAPPTTEEIQAYCNEKHYNVNPEHFIDYYESNGWKVGRNSMKDWKAAVRNWARRDKENQPKGYNSDWQTVNETTETQEERDERERRIRERLLSI